jgi:hypothetical protein
VPNAAHASRRQILSGYDRASIRSWRTWIGSLNIDDVRHDRSDKTFQFVEPPLYPAMVA